MTVKLSSLNTPSHYQIITQPQGHANPCIQVSSQVSEMAQFDRQSLLKILLAASRKAITRNSLQEKTNPTVGLFVNIVKQLHLLEQMTH